MMYGSWYMECDRDNFLSFWTGFCPFIPLWTQKIKIFNMVPQIWSTTDIIFLSFRTIFLLFYPSNNPKNQNFEKMKKLPGDIIILHICIINGNHMMYGSWNMEHDRQNFSSFWTIFCTFIPWTTWKIKILKKWKHHLKILSLYTCVP